MMDDGELRIPIASYSEVHIRENSTLTSLYWTVTNKSGVHVFATFTTRPEATNYAVMNMKEGYDSRIIIHSGEGLPTLIQGIFRIPPKKKEPIHMQMGANANGQGDLTVIQLKDLLEELPGEAVLHIRTDGDQRDGAYWSMRAEWGEERHTSGSGSKIRNFSSPKSTLTPEEAYRIAGSPRSQFGDH